MPSDGKIWYTVESEKGDFVTIMQTELTGKERYIKWQQNQIRPGNVIACNDITDDHARLAAGQLWEYTIH